MKLETSTWDELLRPHTAFWSCAETDRPLIVALFRAYQDTELMAAPAGPGELPPPDCIDPWPLLTMYDEMATARHAIGEVGFTTFLTPFAFGSGNYRKLRHRNRRQVS